MRRVPARERQQPRTSGWLPAKWARARGRVSTTKLGDIAGVAVDDAGRVSAGRLLNQLARRADRRAIATA